MKISLEKNELLEVSYNGVVYVLMGNMDGKLITKFSHVEDRKEAEREIKTRRTNS